MSSEQWVVLWSHSQRKIHRQTVEDMLIENRKIIATKEPNDFVPIFMTDSEDEALTFVEALRERRESGDI